MIELHLWRLDDLWRIEAAQARLKSVRRFFSRPSSRSAPRIPQGVRVYAVGDVHGRADLLTQTFSQIDIHLAQYPVSRAIEVFLGDYVDRGPDSNQVIDLLAERGRTREAMCLKGNHETYIFDFLNNPTSLDHWRQYGGYETLLSYGLKPPIRTDTFERRELARSFANVLPRTHREFLSGLRTTFTCGDYLFVHAGIKPGVPLDQQQEEDLLWIRDDFLLSEENFEKYIVHGHTPVREPDVRHNRINIDTGAYATGKLTCVVIEEGEASVL
jgi:serine/threonine protein phosphatase 1